MIGITKGERMKTAYKIFGGDGSGVVFVRTDTAKTSKVTVKNEAGRFVHHTYRFPNVPNTLQSPFISWANLNCCNGWRYDEGYLFTAVQDGKKLCAGITFNSETKVTAYLESLSDEYLYFRRPVIRNGPYSWYNVDITRKGSINSYIDIAAVCELYRALGVERLDFEKINELAAAPTLHLLDGTIPFDYGNPKSAEEYAVTGLLLGYPVESTAALLLG
jgi:hypothetical protein